MKTIIHVNQHVVRDNKKNDKYNPPITIKTYKSNDYGSAVNILDKDGNIVARVVYRPDNPLSCGAHVWIETNSKVEVE